MTYETTITRGERGKLKAETVIPLGADRRELRITTDKHPWRPVIECDARVVQVSEDGRSFTHAFGLRRDGSGDYSRTLHSVAGRATEKTLRAVHASGLQLADETLAAARAWYAAQTAKKADDFADVKPPTTPHPKGAGPIDDPWGLSKLD